MNPALELDDVQGLIVRAYSDLPLASFALLGVDDARAARRWLSDSAAIVTPGRLRPDETAVHLGLTSTGLRAVGLGDSVLDLFANEFVEGMTTPFRARALGDTGGSASDQWLWGGPSTPPVHAALLLYGKDASTQRRLHDSEMERAAASGLRVLQTLDTVDLKRKEHFGFHDGVSQPTMAGLPRAAGDPTAVALGEFVLGYENAYGLFGERPVLPASDPAAADLPRDAAGSGGADLGRNGTYLVFRQLSQDVRGFWRFLDERTRAADGSQDEGRRVWLASRMVGRWPSGASLVLSPDRDDPSLGEANDFLYHAADSAGLRCPIGSHVRRSNPRDSLDPRPGSRSSLEVNDHHRVLRRGREYGAPVDPDTLLDDVADPIDRGLHFLCVNASIRRQFEFVQHTWVNSAHFAGLYHDDDPLTGARDRGGGMFTVPGNPVRMRVPDLPRFVSVRGGAYLFMPGIRALRHLGSLGERTA